MSCEYSDNKVQYANVGLNNRFTVIDKLLFPLAVRKTRSSHEP